MKPLLVLLLLLQCAFVVFVLMSVPKENGHLRTALSSLRTPSQSNIAPITQDEARQLRVGLEELITSHKSFTTVSAIFGFVSVALIITMMIPFGIKPAVEADPFEERVRL